jgi:WhiB family redox-sensing transcriptional regulator
MPDNTGIPSGAVPDAPGGRCTGTPNDAYRAVGGEPISILASTGTNRQHREQQPGPAAGILRSQVRELGHSPVPARWPCSRPSTVSCRALVPQGQSCRSLSRPWAPRHPDNIVPAALVLAWIIATAAQPWASQALCAQTDPDLFFSESLSQIAQAKAVCRRFEVLEECRSHALETKQDFGVWGGLDRDERRRLLRRRATRPHTKGAA